MKKHVFYLQQCDVTAKLSAAADRGIVRLVVHMHQSSHSPGVPPGLTEVTKGLHLLVGELTIMLDDISWILHLPVVGDLHTF